MHSGATVGVLLLVLPAGGRVRLLRNLVVDSTVFHCYDRVVVLDLPLRRRWRVLYHLALITRDGDVLPELLPIAVLVLLGAVVSTQQVHLLVSILLVRAILTNFTIVQKLLTLEIHRAVVVGAG